MSETTIIIADDHPLFLSGVRRELESIASYKILAETGDGTEALQLINDYNPDIAILDFEMPGLNGLDIASKLVEKNCDTGIILLTMHRDKKIFYKALDSGIRGYVLKDDAVINIIKAIDNVIAGKHYISDDLYEFLIDKAKVKTENQKIIELISSLTVTEKKVLSLVAELKSNQEIAQTMFISKRTVENHKVNITSKLNLNSSRNLLKFSLQNKDLLS